MIINQKLFIFNLFDDSFQDDILKLYDGDLKLTRKFKETFLKNKFTLEYYGFLPGFDISLV